MKDYTISVVIPLFNKAPYIRATLQSVLEQTLPADEVLIVDDSSTDGGVEAIADLVGGKVRLFRQANSGPGPARNRGASEASSEWVGFLDADDLWAPDHLATLAGVARAVPEADVIATNYIEVSRLMALPPRDPDQSRLAPRLIDYFAESAARSRICASSTAVRRAAFLKSGGFGTFYPGEDVELWVRLALDHRLAISDSITTYYVRQTGGLMDQGQNSGSWQFELSPAIKAIDRLFDARRHGALRASIRQYRAAQLNLAARQSLVRGRPRIARQFIALLRAEQSPPRLLDVLLSRLPAWLLRSGLGLRQRFRKR